MKNCIAIFSLFGAMASFSTEIIFEYAERSHDYYLKYVYSDDPELQTFEFIEGCSLFTLDESGLSVEVTEEHFVLSGELVGDRLQSFTAHFPRPKSTGYGTIVTVPFTFEEVSGELNSMDFECSVRIVKEN